MQHALRLLKIVGIIGAWSEKALEDGKITMAEGVRLLENLAGLLGIKLDLDFTPATDGQGEQVETETREGMFPTPVGMNRRSV